METKFANLKKYDKFVAIFVAFIGILLFLLLNQSVEYIYGDAMGYFSMSSEFMDQGILNFSLKLSEGSDVQYLFSIRGYAWPLLIAVFRLLGLNTHFGWLVVWSLFISLGLAYVIPQLFEELFERKIHFLSRLIPALLTFIFWPGLILYPLSDIPALVISCGGVLLLIKAKGAKKLRRYVYAIFSGILLGFSYYIRTGCIVSVVTGVLIIILYFDKKLLKKLNVLIFFAVGIMITMVPQTFINAHCNGKVTWQVPISFNTDIVSSTYYMGVSCLRYETNMSEKYPGYILAAKDKTASALFMSENIQAEEIGAKELAKSILSHPLEYLGIYAAKFANIIDPRYGEVYIKNLYPFRYGIILLNSIIWFLGGAGIFYQLNQKGNSTEKVKSGEIYRVGYFIKKYFLYIFAGIAPGLLHLAGTHVEPRYFYPVYVFVWMYLAAICPWRSFFRCLRARIISVTILFIVFLGCCSSIWNFTFEEMPYYSYFYQKEPEIYMVEESEDPLENLSDEKDVKVELDNYVYADNKLEFNAHTYITESQSEDVKIAVALVGAEKEYVFEAKTSQNEYVIDKTSNKYLHSEIYFSNYLWDLDNGDYKLILILQNKETKQIADTGKIVTVAK